MPKSNLAEKLIGKSKGVLNRKGATFLTVIGAVGVIGTSVAAAKSTPKALLLLEKAKKVKGEDLTKYEKFKVAAPAYIPAALFGMATISCIFGANVLNKRNQAALVSAYSVLNQSYNEYRDKVIELYGKDSHKLVKEDIAKDIYNNTKIESEDNKQLFYDEYSKRYFMSTVEAVQRAEYRINRHLATRDYAYLNEFYDELGVPGVDAGFKLGWSVGSCYDYYWQSWIDFSHEKMVMDDGTECRTIKMYTEPIMDFENYF